MSRLLDKLRAALPGMSPGYFSMVMATGILSLAADLLHLPLLPELLLWLNWFFFVMIGALALLLAWWHPERVLENLRSHLDRSEERRGGEEGRRAWWPA